MQIEKSRLSPVRSFTVNRALILIIVSFFDSLLGEQNDTKTRFAALLTATDLRRKTRDFRVFSGFSKIGVYRTVAKN